MASGEDDPYERTSAEDLEEILSTVASRFKDFMYRTFLRIDQMKQYDESGSTKGNEIDLLREETQKMSQHWFRDPNSQFKRFLKISNLFPGKFSSRTRTIKTIRDLDRDLNVLCILSEQLDKMEQILRKYNLPGRLLGHSYSFESSEACLENLTRFMRLNWREPAEKSREKGYKSLMDLVSELSRSRDNEKRTVSRELIRVLAHIGAEVSRLLVVYLLTVSASAERDEMLEFVKEVGTVIGSLSIERGSAVILGFEEVVRLFGRAIEDRWIFRRGVEIKDFSRAEREGKVFRLVVMEILRLEVSFGSPDLGFMLESQVLISMGRHLLDNVFEDKLGNVRDNISFLEVEFVSIPDSESILLFYDEFLDLGIKETWNKLCLRLESDE